MKPLYRPHFFYRAVLICFVCSFVCVFSACIAKKKNDTVQDSVDAVQGAGTLTTADPFDDFIASMPLEEKICQLFLVSVDGSEAQASAVLCDIPPGGYILFARNFTGSAEGIIKLTGDVQTFYARLRDSAGETSPHCFSGDASVRAQRIPPFFAIDHEGGEVNRLRGIASPLPSAQSVARFLSPEKAEKLYLYAAQQLAALGIHVNFAPVAETAGEHNTEFLGHRSFGSFEQTQTYASAFIRSFTEGGIFCVLKHFPGNTNDDPHSTLPVLEGSPETVRGRYLSSFISLFSSIPPCFDSTFFKNAADFPSSGILMSHALVPAFDEENPSCFSYAVVTRLLKNELHFDGLIFSDDLYMGAVDSYDFSTVAAAEKALRAGVHVFMLSRPVYRDFIPEFAKKAASDNVLSGLIDNAVKKILYAKLYMGLLRILHTDNDTPCVQIAPLSAIHDTELQLQRFYEAKEKGDAVYYEYWAK